MFDPDNCGCMADPEAKLGPRAHPLYEPNIALRISWGEWGLEHITVPGDACGLDIEHHTFGNTLDGPVLQPHNIDTWNQKSCC